MAKQVKTVIKLQIKGGQANPAPPVGPALGQAGINIMEFCKAYNDQTKDRQGEVIWMKLRRLLIQRLNLSQTPPASDLIKKYAKLKKGSNMPGREIKGSINIDDVRKIVS